MIGNSQCALAILERGSVVRSILADVNDSRHAGQVYDASIMAFRPQRMSFTSTKSAIPWDLAEEGLPGARPTSVSSIASIGSSTSNYSSTPTIATSIGSRGSSYLTHQRMRSNQPPPPVFKYLPTEIYDCILQQLRVVHTRPNTESCATCYTRDLCNLALTSRAWDRAVRPQLYVLSVQPFEKNANL